MRQLKIKEKTDLGKAWADVLMLKKSPDHHDRYLTTWGDKTALGVYEVVTRLVSSKFDAIEHRGANHERGLFN